MGHGQSRPQSNRAALRSNTFDVIGVVPPSNDGLDEFNSGGVGGAGRGALQQFTSTAGQRSPVPLQFSVFAPSGQHTVRNVHSFLGESEYQPLMVVTVRDGTLVLHASSSTATPPLATMALDGADIRIALLQPPTGPSTPFSKPTPDVQKTVAEVLVAPSTHGHDYTFSAPVTGSSSGIRVGGAPTRQQRFEWRQSFDREVRRLGTDEVGWKLVRAGERSQPTGDEVLAICAGASMGGIVRWHFRFNGDGARGHFGEQWMLAVVMSALGIWQQRGADRTVYRKLKDDAGQ